MKYFILLYTILFVLLQSKAQNRYTSKHGDKIEFVNDSIIKFEFINLDLVVQSTYSHSYNHIFVNTLPYKISISSIDSINCQGFYVQNAVLVLKDSNGIYLPNEENLGFIPYSFEFDEFEFEFKYEGDIPGFKVFEEKKGCYNLKVAFNGFNQIDWINYRYILKKKCKRSIFVNGIKYSKE